MDLVLKKELFSLWLSHVHDLLGISVLVKLADRVARMIYAYKLDTTDRG